MGIVVAVGTPKGGSGKSTLCALLADTYEQLGYLAESSTWRCRMAR